MADKEVVLNALKHRILLRNSDGFRQDYYVKVINPEKLLSSIKLRVKEIGEEPGFMAKQILSYIFYSPVGEGINSVAGSHDEEANKRLENDYGVKVVFSDEK